MTNKERVRDEIAQIILESEGGLISAYVLADQILALVHDGIKEVVQEIFEARVYSSNWENPSVWVDAEKWAAIIAKYLTPPAPMSKCQ